MAAKIKGEVWEWVAIFVALLVLWPWILGLKRPVWQFGLYLGLALMLIVAVRRIRRFKDLIRRK